MTDEELSKLEALCEAATPGPWEAGDFDAVGPGDTPQAETLTANLYRQSEGRAYVSASCSRGSCSLFNDMDFIAAARTALPAALAEIRRLSKLNEYLEGRIIEESAARSDALSECARLKALVKGAEWAATSVSGDPPEHDACCPWCGAWECTGSRHKVYCPAFTPEGVAK